MRTRSLKDGMQIDQSIVDRMGRKLICRGTILDEYMINSMQRMGVAGVYIGEGEDEEAQKQDEPEIPKEISLPFLSSTGSRTVFPFSSFSYTGMGLPWASRL